MRRKQTTAVSALLAGALVLASLCPCPAAITPPSMAGHECCAQAPALQAPPTGCCASQATPASSPATAAPPAPVLSTPASAGVSLPADAPLPRLLGVPLETAVSAPLVLRI